MASPEARNQNKQIFNRKLAGHQAGNMRRATCGAGNRASDFGISALQSPLCSQRGV